MDGFDQLYETWLNGQIAAEKNRRRRELLEKGLGHGTVEFLRNVWFPAIGNFDHLYAEWEVRDFHGAGTWTWRSCRAGQREASKSRATVPTPGTWMSNGSRICAGGIVCWRWTDGFCCRSPIFPSRTKRKDAGSWFLPSWDGSSPSRSRPGSAVWKRKRCVSPEGCSGLFRRRNSPITCISLTATPAVC